MFKKILWGIAALIALAAIVLYNQLQSANTETSVLDEEARQAAHGQTDKVDRAIQIQDEGFRRAIISTIYEFATEDHLANYRKVQEFNDCRIDNISLLDMG